MLEACRVGDVWNALVMCELGSREALVSFNVLTWIPSEYEALLKTVFFKVLAKNLRPIVFIALF